MTILDAPALVATYSPLQEEYRHDPMQAVEDYQRVMDYAARHPDAGRTKAGNDLGIPPSRYRSWTDGSKPDSVRGLHTAQDYGWVPLDVDDEVFAGGINVLVAWIFSGGSITSAHFTPTFAVDSPQSRVRLESALRTVGVEFDILREDEPSRATEVRVSEDSSLLGRILSTLGAPVGEKTADAEIALPDYLDDAPQRIREEFVSVYLQNRLTRAKGRTAARLREERSEEYRDSLAALLDDVLDVSVSVSEKNIVLSRWPGFIPDTRQTA